MQRYRYEQLKSDPITKTRLFSAKIRWTIRGLSTVAVLFGIHEAEMANGVDFFDDTPTVARAATVDNGATATNVNVTTSSSTTTTGDQSQAPDSASTTAASTKTPSATTTTPTDSSLKTEDNNQSGAAPASSDPSTGTPATQQAAATTPATDPTNSDSTNTAATPTESVVIKAAVQSTEKTYDGTTNFNGGYPGVKFSVSGTDKFGRPTLTADDFDWSNVKPDASTTPYSVTLNQEGISAVLAANPGAIFTKDDVTAGTATINKADVVLTADNKTKTVGAPDPTLTASPDKLFPNGDKLNYTLKREPGETAGNYAITLSLGDNPNYNITTKDGTLTIQADGTNSGDTKATISAVVGTTSKTYDGTSNFNGGYPVLSFKIDGASTMNQANFSSFFLNSFEHTKNL
ncbi:hypothetical protein IWT5_02134 [Secundilactobacillus silagincola]|uniref:Uncharacterized protein n=1 Tax=Secundilactobacillus silagincola TaxID=1714681 RepID=A0A1Z5J4K9_9LACO|nr:MBG domain-containing protein [Secundilactobacillus silagincola]GAX08965.1 hypothetical protein IWT5_02134 [Secundilactobacillus silagincola]